MTDLRCTVAVDLSGLDPADRLVTFGVGPDGTVCVVTTRAPEPRRPRSKRPPPVAPHAVRVLAFRDGALVSGRLVEDVPFEVHHVQPLGEDVLLACARAGHTLTAGAARNARVYAKDGRLLREMALGDGIASMQATSSGRLWVAYFDEGVFGGDPGRPAAGESGLVAWDATTGAVEWAYAPTPDAGPIADCYALNVASDDDAWCCYYTDFPLVRLRGLAIAASWQAPEAGSDAFAVDESHVLFRGGYERHGLAVLASIASRGRPVPRGEFRLVTPDGRPLDALRALGRADSLYLQDGAAIYQTSVVDALCAL